MKKAYLRWSIGLVLLAGCDSGFDEMNTHPTALTTLEPAYQLNSAIAGSGEVFMHLHCEASFVKQHMRIFSGTNACGNFNVDERRTHNWEYTGTIKNLTELVRVTADDPARSNVHNMARIWLAYRFMIVTDTHGDVPYNEAGRGLDGIVSAAYDSQREIYTGSNGILNELRDATLALSANRPAVATDILYGGNITRWQRLGNSLLLRAAMRLSNVAPNVAAEYVRAAVEGPGGLMQSNDDNAVLRRSANYRNGAGVDLNGGNAHFNYLVADFVDHLRDTNDPRLAAIAVRYVGAMGSGDQNQSTANRNPANQVGMPMGYDNVTIAAPGGPIATDDRVSSLFAYSQIDRTRMMNPLAPGFLVTYAQTRLLLAEAVFRGWATGNAGQIYADAIRGHMQQISTSYPGTSIAQSAIDAYLQANPLEPGRELEQINTQYWIASFLTTTETWANFRRSGYPVLPPNPYPGSELKTEDFVRRIGYPLRELSVNTEMVEAAIQRMGGDLMDTRVWWDGGN